MRRHLILGGCVLVAVVAIGATRASASPTAPCSYGDARQQLDSFPLTFPGFPPPCQFRLFFDGRTFTFGEDDHFLGGIVLREPYDASSPDSRAEAIARLESDVLRSWIAEVTAGSVGEFVEQRLSRTAVKTWKTPQLGQHVWLQWGFVTQLAPGEYVARTELTSPSGDEIWTVRLVITPNAE